MLGNQIQWFEKGTDDFADVPTTLKTLMGRLDDWLRLHPTKPSVTNPKLPSEDFSAATHVRSAVRARNEFVLRVGLRARWVSIRMAGRLFLVAREDVLAQHQFAQRESDLV